MRGSRSWAGVVGVGVAFALVACGGGDPQEQTPAPSKQQATSSTPTPPSSGSSGAAKADPASVEWMDNFCGQFLKITSIGKIEKPKGKPGDIAATKKSVSEYLAKVNARLNDFLSGLEALPEPPAPAGDKAVRNLREIFAPAAKKLEQVKTDLDASAPDDKQALLAALKGIRSSASTFQKAGNPLKVLRGSDLEPALKAAPTCRKFAS